MESHRKRKIKPAKVHGRIKTMRKIWFTYSITNADIVAAFNSGATELFGPGYSEPSVIPELEGVPGFYAPGYYETEGDPNPEAVAYMDLIQGIRNAVLTNNTFLNIANPTNAQVLAQVKALTRQSTGIIRYIIGEME